MHTCIRSTYSTVYRHARTVHVVILLYCLPSLQPEVKGWGHTESFDVCHSQWLCRLVCHWPIVTVHGSRPKRYFTYCCHFICQVHTRLLSCIYFTQFTVCMMKVEVAVEYCALTPGAYLTCANKPINNAVCAVLYSIVPLQNWKLILNNFML